jgi:signal transduction histidine kinase
VRPAPPGAWSLRTWLSLSHVAVLVLPVALWLSTGGLARDLVEQTEQDLENQAAILALFVESALRDAPDSAAFDALGPRLNPLLERMRAETLASVRVVDATGRVVASSGEERGATLADRPEVVEALAGDESTQLRPREPSRDQPWSSESRRAAFRLFLARPLRVGERTVGAVVVSRTPREEVQALYQMTPAWVVLLPLAVTALVAWLIGDQASRSLERLTAVSRRIAGGSFAATADLKPSADSRVSEVRGLTNAFQDMADRLRGRITYIGELAAHISHEFRTPIATLRGTVELLADDPTMPDAQRSRFLGNALAELARLDRLLGGLLALARAEQGEDRAWVDLDALAHAAAHARGVTVEGVAGEAWVHPGQITACFDNLLDNARQHGGPNVTLTLGGDARHASLTVSDDGVGISAANRPRIFDRFFTTARAQGGTGLGLALVRAVAHAHGGDVTHDRANGRTRFTMTLARGARPGDALASPLPGSP